MITDTVTDYAAAVRAALADIPPKDRAELLEDLEDHLEEIAAESNEPLHERLGAPEAYAAELRAAYIGGAARPSASSVLLARARAELGRIKPPSGQDTARFLRELLILWWIMRAALAWLVLGVFFGERLWPDEVSDLFLGLLLLTGSIAVGLWTRDHTRNLGIRIPVICLNVVLIAAVFAAEPTWYVDELWNSEPSDSIPAQEAPRPEADLSNIRVYDKDGKELKDVTLYDQEGRPITIEPAFPFAVKPSGKPKPGNTYPKDLCAVELEYATKDIPVCPS